MVESFQTHVSMMRQALQAAALALPTDVPVGAVVVYRGNVIAQGFNRRELDGDPVGHAEILALQAAARYLGGWRLTGAQLYVTLEPCPMCASAIIQSRVSQMIFGAYDPIMGACGSQYGLLLNSPNLPVLGGILEAECAALLRQFFQQVRQM
jgi:tRNA(adenine34) deaminase